MMDLVSVGNLSSFFSFKFDNHLWFCFFLHVQTFICITTKAILSFKIMLVRGGHRAKLFFFVCVCSIF
jgi:hypothetical protein